MNRPIVNPHSAFSSSVPGMKVGRLVLAMVHRDDYTEESTDFGHTEILLPARRARPNQQS